MRLALPLLFGTACVEGSAALPDAGLIEPDARPSIADSGVELDAGLLPCPPGAVPAAEVVSGDRIAGSLTVFALEEGLGSGIEGVHVLLESGVGRFMSRTDENGCAHFEAPGLAGPVDLHFFPEADAPYYSELGLDGALITMELVTVRPDGSSPLSTVTGTVTGLERIPTSPPEEAAIAVVGALSLGPFAFGLPQRGRSEAPQFGGATAIVGGPNLDLRDFEVALDGPTTVGLAVVAGVVPFPGGVFPQGAVTFTHVGVLSGLSVAAGERREGLVVEVTHPLTATITVELTEVPAEPFRQVQPFVEVADGGVMGLPGLASAPDRFGRFVFPGPALTGAFLGGRYAAALLSALDAGAFTIVYQPAVPDGRILMPAVPDRPADIRAEGRRIVAALAGLDAEVVLGIGLPSRWRWLVRVRGARGELDVALPRVPEGLVDPIRGTLPVVVEWRGVTGPIDWTRVTRRESFTRRWAMAGRITTVSID